jgi:hypothetical protein
MIDTEAKEVVEQPKKDNQEGFTTVITLVDGTTAIAVGYDSAERQKKDVMDWRNNELVQVWNSTTEFLFIPWHQIKSIRVSTATKE